MTYLFHSSLDTDILAGNFVSRKLICNKPKQNKISWKPFSFYSFVSEQITDTVRHNYSQHAFNEFMLTAMSILFSLVLKFEYKTNNFQNWRIRIVSLWLHALRVLYSIWMVGHLPAPHIWQRSGSHSRTARKHGHCLVLHWALHRHPGNLFSPGNKQIIGKN